MGISVLAEIVFTHITDVEIGHLGQGLAGEVGRELGVVHQGGQPLVGVGLVQVDLGHVGPVQEADESTFLQIRTNTNIMIVKSH